MNIQINRKKRKTVTIKVTEKGDVIISCPLSYSDESIKNIILEKQPWITATVRKINNKLNKNIDYYNYTKILFMGECFDITKEDGTLRIGGVTICKVKNNSNIESLLKNWIKKQADVQLNIFLQQISTQLGIKYQTCKVISARKKWGSCNSRSEIRLNYKLIMLKQEYIRYVCIHELCHIKHLNHSKKFWELVKKYCQDYKNIRSEMKNFSFCLELF